MDDGTWMAFMAERLPQVLEDEIKRCSEAFYNAAGDLKLRSLKEVIPSAFPLTCLLYTSDAADDM
eukprot:5881046-Prorocentrum_lima.AAC.1